MNISDLGALGEFIGSVLTLVTLVYLAVQVRQNTAQQKREELISIQHGYNSVLAKLHDHAAMGAFIRGAAKDSSAQDRALSVNWVLQYVNHFQVVHELRENGSVEEEQYRLWAEFAVAVVACPGIRSWWEDEGGCLAFQSGVREMIDARLNDAVDPPQPLNERWTHLDPAAWMPEP